MTKRYLEATIISMGVLRLSVTFITMIFFAVQLSRTDQYRYVYEYKLVNCTPISVKMTYFEHCKKWSPIWTGSSQMLIMDNPFNLKTKKNAYLELATIDLHETRPCVCRGLTILPNHKRNIYNNNKTLIDGCNIWTQCFLNTQFISYMQRDQDSRYNTNRSFVIGMSVAFIFGLGSIIFEFWFFHKSKPDYIEMI
tara:strand:+ start:480 stop:1064 length:585 start_codon:yes stop_codon:yes gene_type:complete